MPSQASQQPENHVSVSSLDLTGLTWEGSEATGSLQQIGQNPVPVSLHIVHVGESSGFSWLVSGRRDSQSLHRIVDEAQGKNGYGADDHSQAVDSTNEAPTGADLEQDLFGSFCQNFLPLYPIVNKKDLLKCWEMGTVPPLLKHCILFIGALHAPRSLLTAAGFSERREATEMYYRKARHVYDNTEGLDRVCLVQSMFMLQFRFGPATDHRDCFWWAGAAVNLAQTIGMHRSTKSMALRSEEHRLWKKIWWLLFVLLPSLS